MALKSIVHNPSLDELNKLNVTKQLQIIQDLCVLWKEVGIDEEQQTNRTTQIWKYVFELLYDIKHEEVSLVEEMKESIKNYEKKISVLKVELQLPKAEKFTGTLIQQEQFLRQLLDELHKTKQKLMSEFYELRAQGLQYSKILEMPLNLEILKTGVPTKEDIYNLQLQVKAFKEEEEKKQNERRLLREFEELRLQGLNYSKILGMSPPSFKLCSPTGVPSKDDIFDLQQQVKALEEEKDKMVQRFFKLKKELKIILEATELSQGIPLKKEIFEEQEDTLNIEKLKQLEQIVNETKKKQDDLENERISLIEKLSALWNSLKIDTKEREIFLLKHTDCRISNLNALRQEMVRCEEILKQNFCKDFSSLKEELMSLWNKCFVRPLENMLPQIDDGKINEIVLENYNNELKKWKKYYKDVEHIIQMISKRQKLWDQLMIFENKAADPNRFKNRGGNLLKEEKERKQLQKTLPELEENIKNSLKNYEKKTGKQFLYYGQKFEDFMKKQWEDRLNQKENKKLTKKKMRLEELRTPSKQSFSTVTSNSTPRKVLRSAEASIFKTPNFSISKQSLRTPISCLRSEKRTTNTIKYSKKNILKEKNKNDLLSGCSDSTTYAQFSSKLNRSSRIHHRSSVLSSEVVGTRPSLNKRKTSRRIQNCLKKNS